MATAVNNSSLRYSGDLVVVCAPKGATFSITLSDTPNDRAPERPWWNFNHSINVPRNPPAAPKAEPEPRFPPPGPPQAFRPLWQRAAASAAN